VDQIPHNSILYINRTFLQKISNKIVNSVEGINKVVYDITSKPPGTIELE